jgi:hypothetical protein
MWWRLLVRRGNLVYYFKWYFITNSHKGRNGKEVNMLVFLLSASILLSLMLFIGSYEFGYMSSGDFEALGQQGAGCKRMRPN